MINRSPRIVIAPLCCLLAVVAFASGECGWLMWNVYLDSDKRGYERAITRAFETQQACEKAIPVGVQNHLKVWSGMYTRVTRVDETMMRAEGTEKNPEAVLLVKVSCWPVGVQPDSISGGATYPQSETP